MEEIKEETLEGQESPEKKECSGGCSEGKENAGTDSGAGCGTDAGEGAAAADEAGTGETAEDGEKSEGDDIENKGETEEIKEKTPEEQLEEMNDKYMRLMAEYQNFRRRTDEEKANISTYANERIAKELLNVSDNFERALAHADDGDADSEGFRSGVELIYKQLLTILKNFGVEPIEAVGKPFDPNFHNAVMTGEAEGVEADTVIEEFQKGYMLRDRCLRPAMVKVSV